MNLKVLLAFLFKHKKLLTVFLILVGLGLLYYIKFLVDHYYDDLPNNIELVEADGPVPSRTLLEQGWSKETRKDFWFTSQGARVMPYDWFLYLEQSGSKEKFRNTANMERLGYLPAKSFKGRPGADNLGGLPIGFAITRNVKGKKPSVGFTCAACHTNQLDYKGHKLLIEGAPTLANFVLLYSELIRAMQATLNDSEKFTRFAKGVLGEEYSDSEAADLRNELRQTAEAAAERQAVNALPAHFPKDFTSYARLDAFGNIANAGSAFGLHNLANRNAPTGPVSYPFLWGTHQSDVVQWNASAPNTPIVGPLVRNVGEVVGVFGGLSITKAPWWQRILGIDVYYESSVDFRGLGQLETWIKELRSPQWPAIFPSIDIEKAARGAILFASNCASCHTVIKREDEGNNYKSNRTLVAEVGTDPITAWNIENHYANSGLLKGLKSQLVTGSTFGAKTKAIEIPINGVVGVVLKRPISALKAGLAPGSHTDKQGSRDLESLMQENISKRNEIDDMAYASGLRALLPPPALGPDGPKLDLDSLVYKGRPLNGIWATAPYLHNGSVPNLWELLKKPSERVKSFKVGSREFQPDVVGYETDKGPSTFKVLDSSGKIMPGNSNLGHAYGAGFTDEEKWDLIEYMKTL